MYNSCHTQDYLRCKTPPAALGSVTILITSCARIGLPFVPLISGNLNTRASHVASHVVRLCQTHDHVLRLPDLLTILPWGLSRMANARPSQGACYDAHACIFMLPGQRLTTSERQIHAIAMLFVPRETVSDKTVRINRTPSFGIGKRRRCYNSWGCRPK